jgi:ABC-type Mn2+/Zn2+ transport system ATPase subunit
MSVIIELDKVTVAYRAVTVLEEVSLKVHRGNFLAVIGPNGAGKTTLLKVILGLVRPVEGTVRVFGRAPWELGPERRAIGYVPQSTAADRHFPVRVADVVMMGRYGRIGPLRRPSAADREAVRRAMERTGVAHLADHSLGRLSGGQRQRVLLARALACEPELLILDEPAAGIDGPGTESLYELLHALHKDGLTTLLVSHDVGVVASFVDGVVCLNRRLVAHGRPEEVLGSEELAQMYGCAAVFFHHGRAPHMVVPKGQCWS